MRFDFFESVKAPTGVVCTEEVFFHAIQSKEVCSLCKKIAEEEDHDKQSLMKKSLPIVTWMASYGGQGRAIKNATPSGLYMMDIDGIADPEAVWKKIKEKDPKKLGIVIAHKTPSTHGLRIIAVNREGLETVVQNQEWFASQFPDIVFDTCVKDLARSSFLVPGSYFYYTETKVFREMWPVYIKNEAKGEGQMAKGEGQRANGEVNTSCGSYASQEVKGEEEKIGTYTWHGVEWYCVRKRSDLFEDKGELYDEADMQYKGLDTRQIVLKWFELHGVHDASPEKGSRNTTLFTLCCSLRYICDFSADLMLACIPANILPRAEVCELIASAQKRDRIVGMPKDIREAVAALRDDKKQSEEDDDDESVYDQLQNPNDLLPIEKLPPIFKQFVQIAPPDFRKATVVALLPMLGTLGSRLRAVYVDGMVQTPSFQCEIEAPMASGKSFTRRIYNNVMKDVIAADTIYREKEADYDEKCRQAKNAKEQPEKETYPIRLLGSKVSIGALLDRMANAHGLHVFSFDEEVRNVLDSMNSGPYGQIRAMLRCAFDNAIYGQDYKSDGSSKRQVPVFYNTLHCGTPAEYRKLYNNAEDGTITRILFCELPDQKFKKMPVFNKLTYFQQRDIDRAVKRLSDISMKDDKIQSDYELKNFNFMREWADKWQEDMRLLSMKFDDINLDTFRRRAAVVGFRAGMIAWFLFDKDTEVNRAKTCSFAQMIAEQMVVALMQRYKVTETSNVITYKNVWNKLGDVFTKEEFGEMCQREEVKTLPRVIIYRWKQKHLIKVLEDKKYKKMQK